LYGVIPDRARQHVAFRASAVLLLLMSGLLACIFARWHSCASIFNGQWLALLLSGCAALGIGTWQMVIIRRIDYLVVKKSKDHAAKNGSS